MADDDVRMRATILVVEDDEATRIAIVALLTSRGFITVTARHGADALATMREIVPDLILFDVRMTEMDGHAFRAAQRADARCSEVPVIAMTAEPASWGHSVRLGAPVLYKPFRADALYAIVERELRPGLRKTVPPELTADETPTVSARVAR
jgi:CheY-like chemotaxis protein